MNQKTPIVKEEQIKEIIEKHLSIMQEIKYLSQKIITLSKINFLLFIFNIIGLIGLIGLSLLK